MQGQQRLRIFTWHIHGAYLYYLSLGNYDIYIPYDENKSDRYVGRGNTYPFGPNVIEVPVQEVRNMSFDLILYQCDENYLEDQQHILSAEQRMLPRIYIEHDPPRGHPTNEVHPVQDPAVTVVHVTHFNKLMWDTAVPDVRVISHGVATGTERYKGTIKKGIVVINNIKRRGRLLGHDIFERVREAVPLDIVGMGAEEYGIGEVLHPDLPAFISQYRFFFHPIRYTSLGLSVCEAMMIGMPVVGLATTELTTVIKNGESGYIHTDIDYLIDKMQLLLQVPTVAYDISNAAYERATELFDIRRFTADWERLFIEKVNTK